MSPRRWYLSLGFAALVCGGLSRLGDAGGVPPTAVTVPARSVPPSELNVAPLAASPAPAPVQSVLAAPAAVVPIALPQDGQAQLAEVVALQQLAGGELQLTPRQWATFAAVSSHFQAVRHAYEATLGEVRVTAPNQVRVEIPAYPEAGDALRARFFAELAAQMGHVAADEIGRRMGSKLEGYFAGFGVSVQTLEFEAGAQQADDYRVTRTIRYWDAVAAGQELNTRRETHFPALEDPSGHQWGPFLAAIASRAGVKS